jgi:hypothetical protein
MLLIDSSLKSLGKAERLFEKDKFVSMEYSMDWIDKLLNK